MVACVHCDVATSCKSNSCFEWLQKQELRLAIREMLRQVLRYCKAERRHNFHLVVSKHYTW